MFQVSKYFLESKTTVTNSYSGSTPVQNELHQVSKGSKSHLISGGDSSCSWVLVCALDPVKKEELQAITLGGKWEVEYCWGAKRLQYLRS